MSRFIILLPNASKQNEEAFIAKLGTSGWWHHLSGGWLVCNDGNELTSIRLRDWITEIDPSLHSLVVEVPDGGDWAARLPTASIEKSNEWFATNWD